MGRVAKYKKIKACDPYSKKNRGNVKLNQVGVWGLGDSGRKVKKRSLKAQMMRKAKKRNGRNGDDGTGGFDLPPTEDDFDMKDLLGVKKQKLHNPILTADLKNKIATETIKVDINNANSSSNTNLVATIPKTDEDERKVARMLKVEQKVKENQQKKQVEAATTRQEGESRNAYKKRTKVETRNIIQSSRKINSEKRERKKEFLKNKKKAKKKGASYAQTNNNDGYQSDDNNNNNNDGDELVTGERAVAAMQDQVQFGEQAERPPSFRQLPRGASKKKGKKHEDSDGKSTGMSETEVRAERDAMELLRRKIQAQYSAIKLQRRRNGDFHL